MKRLWACCNIWNSKSRGRELVAVYSYKESYKILRKNTLCFPICSAKSLLKFDWLVEFGWNLVDSGTLERLAQSGGGRIEPPGYCLPETWLQKYFCALQRRKVVGTWFAKYYHSKGQTKKDHGAITNFALSNSPKEVTKFKYISPPKGSSISSCMGDLVLWIVEHSKSIWPMGCLFCCRTCPDAWEGELYFGFWDWWFPALLCFWALSTFSRQLRASFWHWIQILSKDSGVLLYQCNQVLLLELVKCTWQRWAMKRGQN